MVSESFGTYEAVLFWNLRGSGRSVTWLSFSELECELTRVAEWLDSDLGGGIYELRSDTRILSADSSRIGFAAAVSSLARLEELVGRLSTLRTSKYPEWRTCVYGSHLWDQPPLVLKSKSVLVGPGRQRLHFALPTDRDNTGVSRFRAAN